MENAKGSSLGNANGSGQDYKSSGANQPSTLDSMSHNAGKKIGEMTSNFAHSSSEYVKSGRDFVVHNPAKGVAIAAATGAVVGSLITLAMRRRD